MAKQYLVRAGFSFVGADNTVTPGGGVIELDDDVAALHLHKLDAVPPATKKPAQKSAKAPVADAALAGGEAAAPAAPVEAVDGEPAPPAGEPAAAE